MKMETAMKGWLGSGLQLIPQCPPLAHNAIISYAKKNYGDVLLQTPKGFDLAVPKTTDPLMGMEIEVENLPGFLYDHHLTHWWVKPDGSLRNHGMEFVSGALTTLQMFDAVIMLMNYMVRYAPKHEFSWRTSIHVHCNIRDMEDREFLRFLVLYLMFENSLFQYAGVSRRNSVFCVPLLESDTLIMQIVREWNKHRGKKTIKLAFNGLVEGWDKYAALGIFRLSSFGTLEFRHLSGTNDVKKILGWTCLIHRLYKAAQEISDEVLMHHIQTINTVSHYAQFRDDVFKEYSELLMVPNYEQDIAHGTMRVKEFMFYTPIGDLIDRRVKNTGVNALIKKSQERELRRRLAQKEERREELLRRFSSSDYVAIENAIKAKQKKVLKTVLLPMDPDEMDEIAASMDEAAHYIPDVPQGVINAATPQDVPLTPNVGGIPAGINWSNVTFTWSSPSGLTITPNSPSPVEVPEGNQGQQQGE